MLPANLITAIPKDLQPIGSICKGRNMVRKYKAGLTNEKGTTLVNAVAGTTVGIITTPIEEVRFVTNTELVSGVFKNVGTLYRTKAGVTTTVFRSTELRFTSNFPIQGTFEYNYRGDLILIWWEGVLDGANNIRTINLNCLPFEINPTTKFILDEDKIKLLELIPETCPPMFETATVRNSGGQLKTGSFILFAYYKNDDGTTKIFTFGTPISIYSQLINSDLSVETNPYGSPGVNYDVINFEGNDGGEATSKSIKLTFSNIDTDFDKLVVGAIQLSGGVTTAFVEPEVDITGETQEYIFTGNIKTVVSIEEVLGLNAAYIKAESGGILDGRLYLGNLTEESMDIEELQEIANDIVVKWDFETPVGLESDEPGQSYKDPNVDLSIKGFFPDEVYGLYIGFYTHKGNWHILHIPGRVAGVTDYINTSAESDFDFAVRPATNLIGISETATLDSLVAANGGVHLSQLEDAASVSDNVKFFQMFDTSKSDGTMGYWENDTETYPACFPDFGGQKVRHHKTPSLEQLHRRFSKKLYYDAATEGVTTIDGIATRVLSLNFSNIVIPDDVKAKLCYWGIFYAKRDFSNSSHICTGYMSNKTYATETPTQLPLTHTAATMETSLRFNSFSLLRATPSITPSYFKTHFKIALPETSPGSNEEVDHQFINNAAYYYDKLQANIEASNYEAIRKVTNGTYYPEHVIIPGDDGDGNLYGEETYKIEFDNPMIETDHGLLMGSLYAYKVDVYKEYDQQEIVFTGKVYLPTTTTANVFGGDCYVTPYSFKLHTVIPSALGGINPYIGCLYRVPAYSSDNIWLRQEGEELWETFYPKTMIHEYAVTSEEEFLHHGNYYGYNTDYSNLHLSPFFRRFLKRGCAEDTNCSTDLVTKFPYRIARSVVQGDETTSIRFRMFRINDFSEIRRDTGVISGMVIYQNGLFVTTEYSSYYFNPQQILATDDQALALYGADLFEQKPLPLLESAGGYGGCKSKFSLIVTVYGVIYVDVTMGRMYLFSGALSEITADIRYDFEAAFKRTYVYLDNPIYGAGVICGFDKDYNRVLVTSVSADGKDPNVGNTYSFDLERKEWVTKHDYYPNLYSFSIRGMSGVLNNPDPTVSSLWTFNTNAVHGMYLGVAYDSYIDIVLSNVGDSFIVKSLSWVTRAVQAGIDVSQRVTISQVMAYNDNQSSGLQPVLVNTSLPFASKNASYRQGGWTVGGFKDVVINRENSLFLSTDLPNNANLNQNKVMKIRPFMGNFIVFRLLMTGNSVVEITIVDVGVDLRSSTASSRLKKI